MFDDRDEGDGACADPGRLEALRGYEILDTPREPEFDSLAELASRVCRTPIAAVNLIEDRRQWFKAEVGIGVREMPVDVSICRHFLLRPGLNIVRDTRADPRLSGNPLVTGEPGLRFYAGCPLQTPEGHALGTLCVLDHRPRDLDEDQRFALRTLSAQVMAQMNLRLALRQKQRLVEQRDLLLDEMNHRVKNSLQLITSIVGLRARSVADPAGRAALKDVQARVASLGAVHEHLYRSDQAGTVEFAAYLRDLVERLRPSLGLPAPVDLRAEPTTVPLAWAVPLALIANELVTNAAKHAYPDGAGGPVRITLTRAPPGGDGGHVLTVADEGRGLPPGSAALRPGTATLGMRLLEALAKQIGARLTVAEGGPGTRIAVFFGEAGSGA